MQSYLGEYPCSRTDSSFKFIRAVQSFINQTYKNSELIIASDGCEKTHELYYKHFKNEPRIKYVYVDKDTPNMYEGEIKYYRGLPRQVARSLVTGEITTYMDSDDFLLPIAAEVLNMQWTSEYTTKSWALIDRWFDNEVFKTVKVDSIDTENDDITINGLSGKWCVSKMAHSSLVLQATWAISHKSETKTKWVDVYGKGYSEDTQFCRSIVKEFGQENGFLIQIPFYVRCHFYKLWDY